MTHLFYMVIVPTSGFTLTHFVQSVRRSTESVVLWSPELFNGFMRDMNAGIG